MYHFNQLILLIGPMILGITLLVSCASPPTKSPDEVPVHFEDTTISSAPTYQDSPMYLKDKHIASTATTTATTAKNMVGELANKESYDSLDTNTLLMKAESLYKNQDYNKALSLFNLAVKRPDNEQLMKTYAGIYQTNLQLKHQQAAKEAFGKLLAVSVEENKKLNLKFLFSVNSTEFINDAELRNEYSFWLRQIANYFDNNALCFQIEGHSSFTEEQNNSNLSLLRAQKIQQLIKASVPAVIQRSKVVGKGGYHDNIVGTNTNNVMDTIDRRVEIVIGDCL